ncbi:MAG: YeeE/YedE thiosulfate transporter family protein [Bacteroidota bacterium]
MNPIIDFLFAPWPWYITGPLMGATIPLLLFSGNKMLGASSTLRHLCALSPSQLDYFNYDLRVGWWNLLFALGICLGAGVCYYFFYDTPRVELSDQTVAALQLLGVEDQSGLMPKEIFAMERLLSPRSLLFTAGGGFLVGFGVRYAGGCTSGHGFMGLSQLATSSFVAVVAFFAGGVVFTHFILPLLWKRNIS